MDVQRKRQRLKERLKERGGEIKWKFYYLYSANE